MFSQQGEAKKATKTKAIGEAREEKKRKRDDGTKGPEEQRAPYV
jgi:hypothetical protein